jgi:fumarate reductase subunit C
MLKLNKFFFHTKNASMIRTHVELYNYTLIILLLMVCISSHILNTCTFFGVLKSMDLKM